MQSFQLGVYAVSWFLKLLFDFEWVFIFLSHYFLKRYRRPPPISTLNKNMYVPKNSAVMQIHTWNSQNR